MPSTRLSPARSLQKLRTVFSLSPLDSTTSASPASPSPLTLSSSSSSTATPSTSPTMTLSPTPSQLHPFAGFAGFNFGNANALSPTFASPEDFSPQLDSRRVIRRKKSHVELELEQERFEFDGALVGLVEPRPRAGLALALGGIEEVLCGKV